MNPIVVIPTRLGSTRLPGKALAEIAGEPMIVHVWRRGLEAGIGPVLVACGDAPIAEAVRAVGGEAATPTDPALPTGSDRVQAALAAIDPDRRHDVVVVLQGELPMIEPSVLRATLAPLADPAVDISTLATLIADQGELEAPQVVKIALSGSGPARAWDRPSISQPRRHPRRPRPALPPCRPLYLPARGPRALRHAAEGRARGAASLQQSARSRTACGSM